MPGVSPDAFRLPHGTALRYERPAPALAALLPSYAVLDSDNSLVDHKINWMLPSWAQIWIQLTAGPITVNIGNRRYEPLPAAVMYGVTSRAMPVTAQGETTVAIDVSPLGWARLVSAAADEHRDQIVPLDRLLSRDLVQDLVATLHATDHDLGVKAAIDTVFARHLPPQHAAEPAIERIMAALTDPDIDDLGGAADNAGLSHVTLQRMCRRYFGFSPKLLLLRMRFLRVIVAMLTSDDPVDHSRVPPGYHNVPHFLRDANRFLGMTPRRFNAMDMPYLRAALRARQLVLATPTPALDRVSVD